MCVYHVFDAFLHVCTCVCARAGACVSRLKKKYRSIKTNDIVLYETNLVKPSISERSEEIIKYLLVEVNICCSKHAGVV